MRKELSPLLVILIMRVDCDVASIPPLRVDILLSGESVQFGAKMIRMEPDNKVELKEVLR